TPPSSAPFPYTTLFRSPCCCRIQPIGSRSLHRVLMATTRPSGVNRVNATCCNHSIIPRQVVSLFASLLSLIRSSRTNRLAPRPRSEEHTSELQSRLDLV